MSTIEELFDQLPHGVNRWINDGKMEVYVRKTRRSIGKMYSVNTFDIANINVHSKFQSKGYFTKFLEHVEKKAKEQTITVFVENVFEHRLGEFLKRRGYTRVDGSEPPCYFL